MALRRAGTEAVGEGAGADLGGIVEGDRSGVAGGVGGRDGAVGGVADFHAGLGMGEFEFERVSVGLAGV